MNDMKAMARPFLTLYAMGLVIAILARIGLTVAGGTGVLAFGWNNLLLILRFVINRELWLNLIFFYVFQHSQES